MPPKLGQLGGVAPKCKYCSESVYPNEKIDYDGVSYHTSCFKCQNCKSVLTLTAVAMISGDLYCKTCFKKIFLKEGRYSSFGDKTLPHAQQHGSGSGSGSGSTADKSANNNTGLSAVSEIESATAAVDLNNHTSPTGRRGSVQAPCVVPECKNNRLDSKNFCSEHSELVSDSDAAKLQPLLDAIEKRESNKVTEFINENGVECLLKYTARGVTPIELAFTGVRNSRQCGQLMLDAIRNELNKNKK